MLLLLLLLSCKRLLAQSCLLLQIQPKQHRLLLLLSCKRLLVACIRCCLFTEQRTTKPWELLLLLLLLVSCKWLLWSGSRVGEAKSRRGAFQRSMAAVTCCCC
jgi:hypothetical protein